MKRKFLLALIAGVVTLSTVGCGSGHYHNDISIKIDEAVGWFEDTGIIVKNNQSERAYHIVKDKHGWLYYASSADESLEAVRDVDGNMTKDLTIFEKQGE